MKTAEYVRMIGYLAGIALGLFFAVYGALKNDGTLIASGLSLVTVGGTAGGALARQTGRHGR